MPIAAGLHDDSVGNREEEEQEDLGERGDSEVGDNGEGAGHTGEQSVPHVGTSSVCSRAVVRSEPEHVCSHVLHREAGVCPNSPPRNTSHLEEWMERMKQSGLHEAVNSTPQIYM